MGINFERQRRKGKGILFLLLVIGVAIGYPIGFYLGAEAPSDYHLTMVFSSEKKGWIEDMVSDFKEWFYQQHGKTVSVNFRSMGSREMVIALQTGEINPILWSPASNLQLALLNAAYPEILNLSQVFHLIYSPTIIGTWNTSYPGIEGFEDLRQIAIQPSELRFAHTDPRLSNSGYTSMMMQLAAFFNYTTGSYYNASKITVENITDESGIDDTLAGWLEGIEKEADYYGKSTGYLAEKAKTDYDVYYVYENIIIELNQDPLLNKKAIAIYPEEGLFTNAHPFCILDASWISEEDAWVAKQYMTFMGLNSSIERAFTRGFRPYDNSILTNSTYNQTFNNYFNSEFGVQYNPPMLVHSPPEDALVLDYVTDVWITVRAD